MKKNFHSKIFNVILENGKIVQGKYVELSFENSTVKKIFFKVSNEKREFCIKNLSLNFDDFNWEKQLCVELNDYFEFLWNQSKLEFPEWLAHNGKKAAYPDPINCYSIDEITKEWKSMKNLFGIYRMAADCGFFTSKKPLACKQLKIVKIEEVK